MKRKIGILFLSLALLYQCQENEDLTERSAYDSFHQGSKIELEEKTLVLNSKAEAESLLAQLNVMNIEALTKWSETNNFKSYKYIFESVVAAEWAISDYYEAIAVKNPQGVEIPSTQIFSQEYDLALSKGLIRIIKDDEGEEYFDYPFFEVNMAPLLNAERLVKIEGKIFQYNLKNKKIIEDGDLNKIQLLDGITQTDDELGITVIHYLSQLNEKERAQRLLPPVYSKDAGESISEDHNVSTPMGFNTTVSWQYSSKEGNGWHKRKNGKYRARAYVTGSSYEEEDLRIYVTNMLRIEAQKKNFWGNYKYNGTYEATADVTWNWYYEEDNTPKQDLPVPTNAIPPSLLSPLQYTSNNVNNAYISLAPHVNGYYTGFIGLHDCSECLCFCGDISPVYVTGVSGTIQINGFTLHLDQ